MGEVFFYQLTRAPLEVALPQLLNRALGSGWRVLLRGRNAGTMQWLDEQLWLGEDASFLPHGMAGGKEDADHPVLLTCSTDPASDRDCLMIVEAADVPAAEVPIYRRICILFDGNDPDALTAARGQWRDLTSSGAGAQFWSDESGRWEMKSERAAKVPDSA